MPMFLRILNLVLAFYFGELHQRNQNIADNASAASNESKSIVSLRMAQRISCSRHREHVWAVLRRLVPPTPETATAGWGASSGGDLGGRLHYRAVDVSRGSS